MRPGLEKPDEDFLFARKPPWRRLLFAGQHTESIRKLYHTMEGGGVGWEGGGGGGEVSERGKNNNSPN